MKKLLTPTQVATFFNVSPVTVRQWSQKGLIEFKITPGGHRRYTLEAVEECAKKMNVELNLEMTEGASVTQSKSHFSVLVVDDNEELNEMIVEMLSVYDERILTKSAFNGFDAGFLLETFSPDMILLDIMMPGLDGYQVCKSIRQKNPTIKIIGMTGQYSDEVVLRMKASGANAVLRKPFSLKSLIEVSELGLLK